MLLPNFSFSPDGDIQLGTLIPISKGTPDPSVPLTDKNTLIAPDEKIVKRDTQEPKGKPWSYIGSTKGGSSAGFSVQLPFLTALGFDFGLKKNQNDDIAITCRRVETSSFAPSKDFITKALKSDLVQEYAEQHWRPSLFMVTGIKVAFDVPIEHGRQKNRDFQGDLSVDLTSAGVPLRLGPDGGTNRDEDHKLQTQKPGPLILAYELK